MYKFFVEKSQITETAVMVTGSDLNHMKNVLRFKPGKEVLAGDGDGNEFLCIIESYAEGYAELKVVNRLETSRELPVEIVLYQGLPKKDKMEWVIQKSVELGVSKVIPLSMKRSIVKLDEKSKRKKQIRWQGIADAAAKQAKRGIQPEVGLPVSMKAIEEDLRSFDLLLIPYENALGMPYTREVLSEVKNCDRIGIVIGPEGGFDPDEINYLTEVGGKIISLGKRILRTETAGLALMSYLMIDMEDTEHVC